MASFDNKLSTNCLAVLRSVGSAVKAAGIGLGFFALFFANASLAASALWQHPIYLSLALRISLVNNGINISNVRFALPSRPSTTQESRA